MDQSGAYRVPLNKLTVEVPSTIKPLTDNDCRAQKIPTKRISYETYQKLVEPIDLYSGQFMLCNNPRDARLTLTKISHDNQIAYKTPNVIKVYYDIETFDLEKSGVPEHTSRTAFISMVGMVVVHPHGLT